MKTADINNSVSARYKQITSLIEKCRIELSKCPQGRLRISSNVKSVTYYHVGSGSGSNGVRLNSDDVRLVSSLAQKSYLETLLRSLLKEQKMLKGFMDRYPSCSSFEKVYESLSEDRRLLISPLTLPDKEFADQWRSVSYSPKEIREGSSIYMTLNGEQVRSKSEQIIADRLAVNNIPYRYECPLIVGKRTFYTDFTILRLSDRKEIYYEHFGMMDNEEYAAGAIWKINEYALNGIALGDRLFATFETYKNPLDTRVLDSMINNQFR